MALFNETQGRQKKDAELLKPSYNTFRAKEAPAPRYKDSLVTRLAWYLADTPKAMAWGPYLADYLKTGKAPYPITLENETQSAMFRYLEKSEWIFLIYKYGIKKWCIVTASKPSQSTLRKVDMLFLEVESEGFASFKARSLRGKILTTTKKGNKMPVTKNTSGRRDNRAQALYIGGDYVIVGVVYTSTFEALTRTTITTPAATDYYKLDISRSDDVELGSALLLDWGEGISAGRVVEILKANEFCNVTSVRAQNSLVGWVVDVINTKEQASRIEATERKEAILVSLEEKREQLEELQIYAALAQSDPEAARLLTELKQLGK